MGWNEVVYTTNEEVYSSLSDLVTLAYRNRTGSVSIVGTAFPVFASKNNILMLTATHVIEEAYDNSYCNNHKTANRFNYLPGPDNKPYELMAEWVETTEDLWCLVDDDGKLVQCHVTGVCLRPPLDMALLVLDTSHLESVTKVFAINSNVLNKGDEIVITSLITEGNTRELIARHGYITDVKSRGNLVDAPVYQTNIPIEAGASGGPVFRYTGNFNSTKEVIGVITSDFSEQQAFTEPSIDGYSYVSIICSATPLNIKSTDGLVMTFQDMCLSGYIRDVGGYINDVILTNYEDGNWSQSFPKTK